LALQAGCWLKLMRWLKLMMELLIVGYKIRKCNKH